MTTKKLKPCPCCGSKVDIATSYEEGFEYVQIKCSCGLQTKSIFHSLPICKAAQTGRDGRTEVTNIWNKRK